MARTAEASKEQIKVMNARVQLSEANQSVNVLRYGANQGKEQIGSHREKTKAEKCGFCGMVHTLRYCPAFGKTCNYCKKTGHFERVCQVKQQQCDSRPREVNILEEFDDGEVSDDDLLTFSVESNNEGGSKNDWHVQLNLEVDSPKIETEFSDVFEGLGGIKDVQYQIKIDPVSIPVVHPPQRVPMALRKPLEEELRRME
ncbi:Hypothetical predicted protein [Paramuricea clavata]|uniref:Uncharacterized protein n=1 Tax=Paramuricea clavata TaxID=317549 RepID=A0A6S7HPY3_PARCT|nr:Hypothetical predicted protein [Paramuricea clavata]